MRDGEHWAPFPKWSRFLLDVGAAVGTDAQTDGRLVVALGLPTRAYAAPLLAAGVVAARLRLESPTDAASHFAAVCAQQPGAPVLLEVSGRRLAGTFVGSQLLRGECWAKVLVQQNRETHFVSESEALRITLSGLGSGTPGGEPSATRMLVQRRAFIRQALGRRALANMTRESRLECVLVGRRNLLRHEATELRIGIPSIADPERFQRARVSDVLRIRSMLQHGHPYRSEILSAVGRRAAADVGATDAHVAVFDGATSYLKWRHLWPASSWIVVLDQTEPRCRDAAASLDSLYVDRSVSGPVPMQLATVPTHVEIAAFRLPATRRQRASA